jgi:hypothetical protein
MAVAFALRASCIAYCTALAVAHVEDLAYGYRRCGQRKFAGPSTDDRRRLEVARVLSTCCAAWMRPPQC